MSQKVYKDLYRVRDFINLDADDTSAYNIAIDTEVSDDNRSVSFDITIDKTKLSAWSDDENDMRQKAKALLRMAKNLQDAGNALMDFVNYAGKDK